MLTPPEDFWRALTRDLSNPQIILTITSFFGIPFGFGIISFALEIQIPEEQFSSLISIYAIFSALLFGAQISAFSIFRSLTELQISKPDQENEDLILKESLEAESKIRVKNLKLAFRDINSNISYLILVSVVLLSILIFFAVADSANVPSSSIVIALTAHLLLVLIMVIRQCHLIFNAAYTE